MISWLTATKADFKPCETTFFSELKASTKNMSQSQVTVQRSQVECLTREGDPNSCGINIYTSFPVVASDFPIIYWYAHDLVLLLTTFSVIELHDLIGSSARALLAAATAWWTRIFSTSSETNKKKMLRDSRESRGFSYPTHLGVMAMVHWMW